MSFTIDELTIFNIYKDEKRDDIVEKMNNSLPYVQESEIKETMSSVIRKLSAMDDIAVKSIDDTDILEIDSPDIEALNNDLL